MSRIRLNLETGSLLISSLFAVRVGEQYYLAQKETFLILSLSGLLPRESFVYSLGVEQWQRVGDIVKEFFPVAGDEFFHNENLTPEFYAHCPVVGDSHYPQKSPDEFPHFESLLDEKHEDVEFWKDFFRHTSFDLMKSVVRKLLRGTSQQGVESNEISKMIKEEFSQLREELSRAMQGTVAQNSNFTYEDEIESWKDSAKHVQNELSQVKEDYENLKEEHKTLWQKYDHAVKKYRTAKSKIQEYVDVTKELSAERQKNQQLKEDLESLSKKRAEDVAKMTLEFTESDQHDQNRNSSQTKDIQSENLSPDESLGELQLEGNEEEEQRSSEEKVLTGGYFEVYNDRKWFVKKFDQPGPYTLTEIIEFKNKELIDLETLVRESPKGLWRRVTDFIELCAPLKVKKEKTSSGEVQCRYFLKRASYRVPFYEVVTFQVGEKTLRGYCTSLSMGGCFIELSKSDQLLLQKGSKGVVTFQEGTLRAGFSCEVEVMNFHGNKPRGVGLMFHNLTELNQQYIGEYVQQHFSRKTRAA